MRLTRIYETLEYKGVFFYYKIAVKVSICFLSKRRSVLSLFLMYNAYFYSTRFAYMYYTHMIHIHVNQKVVKTQMIQWRTFMTILTIYTMCQKVSRVASNIHNGRRKVLLSSTKNFCVTYINIKSCFYFK